MADIPDILAQVEEAGHTVFTRGAWNVNIVGVRSAPREANLFDDRLHLVFKDDFGVWVDLSLECTTDPGTYWLSNPIHVAGTAILKAGQYRGAYKLGNHRGKEALCQYGAPVTVFRDSDRDDVLDLDPLTEAEGYLGINIHRAGEDSTQVHKWSAGCQVIANDSEFRILMAIAHKSAAAYGDSFTYTLLED